MLWFQWQNYYRFPWNWCWFACHTQQDSNAGPCRRRLTYYRHFFFVSDRGRIVVSARTMHSQIQSVLYCDLFSLIFLMPIALLRVLLLLQPARRARDSAQWQGGGRALHCIVLTSVWINRCTVQSSTGRRAQSCRFTPPPPWAYTPLTRPCSYLVYIPVSAWHDFVSCRLGYRPTRLTDWLTVA